MGTLAGNCVTNPSALPLVWTLKCCRCHCLQDEIAACDRGGGRNAGIPSGEDLGAFAQLLAAASSQEEVECLVRPVLGV